MLATSSRGCHEDATRKLLPWSFSCLMRCERTLRRRDDAAWGCSLSMSGGSSSLLVMYRIDDTATEPSVTHHLSVRPSVRLSHAVSRYSSIRIGVIIRRSRSTSATASYQEHLAPLTADEPLNLRPSSFTVRRYGPNRCPLHQDQVTLIDDVSTVV